MESSDPKPTRNAPAAKSRRASTRQSVARPATSEPVRKRSQSAAVTIRDVAGNSSVPGYSTTNPYMLPADGQWHLAEFNMTAADMTAVNPTGGTMDPFSFVLSNVAEFRILSSTVPAVVGDMITAQVGIDDITALPPPQASVWTGASSTSARLRRR